MQGRVPPNKMINKITNPNFIKTPPQTSYKSKIENSIVHSNKNIIQKIKSARLTSIINISNMNLENLPKEIFEEGIKFEDVNWWDMVEIKKLDASNNKLSEDSFQNNSEIYNFNLIPGLTILKFSFNLFKAIPDSIFSLIHLKYLDFSNNKISNLNSDIKNLKSLVEINLSNNILTFIPEEIGYQKELEILNLGINKISQLPKTIGNLKKLKKLDLSENILVTIPLEINNLCLLEEFILFKNKIISDYNNTFSIEDLTNLKYLDMHNNLLVNFKNFPHSEKLDTIILGYNKLEKIENLKNAPNLSVLDLNNNKLENFPDEVLQLKEIKTLNLMNNSINDIPPKLCFLKNLVRINIEGNPLKKINFKIRSSNAENLKAYLKTRLSDEDIKNIISDNTMDVDMMDIDLNSNMKANINKNYIVNFLQNNILKMNNLSLEEIPIDHMKKCLNLNLLISIDFSYNKINKLENFELVMNNLPELKEVKFTSNRIEFFPDFFLNLYNLKIIDLKNNLLMNFLDIFDEKQINNIEKIDNILPNLEYLDLSINKFTNIPTILNFLKKLSVFLISNNSISDISNILQNEYLYLDTLDLGTNKIENIKDKIYKNFPNLKNFNLENNEIKSVPTDLCILSGLNKLNINGNPIKMLRSNIINGGSKMILDHLKKMHKFDSEDFTFEKKNLMNANNFILKKNNNKEEEKSGTVNINVKNTSTKIIKSELDEVNEEILEVENELNQNINMPMFKKTDLRKKLNSLIRLRANLLK